MNEIIVQLLCGVNRVTGQKEPSGLGDTDEILCNGRRIGFASHRENQGIRFLLPRNRITDATLEQVCDEVKRIRQEQGKPELSGKLTFLPDPAEMRKAAAELDDEWEEDDE